MSTAEAVLNEVLEAFDFGAPVVGATRFSHGHINDTFCVHTQPKEEACRRFILQRMSSAAFKRPEDLMRNIIGVTEYLGRQIESNGGAFATVREADCSVALQALRDGVFPPRVTHNDTKLNNVLIDVKTDEGLCVIDLDTVMPGLSINASGKPEAYFCRGAL